MITFLPFIEFYRIFGFNVGLGRILFLICVFVFWLSQRATTFKVPHCFLALLLIFLGALTLSPVNIYAGLYLLISSLNFQQKISLKHLKWIFIWLYFDIISAYIHGLYSIDNLSFNNLSRHAFKHGLIFQDTNFTGALFFLMMGFVSKFNNRNNVISVCLLGTFLSLSIAAFIVAFMFIAMVSRRFRWWLVVLAVPLFFYIAPAFDTASFESKLKFFDLLIAFVFEAQKPGSTLGHSWFGLVVDNPYNFVGEIFFIAFCFKRGWPFGLACLLLGLSFMPFSFLWIVLLFDHWEKREESRSAITKA